MSLLCNYISSFRGSFELRPADGTEARVFRILLSRGGPSQARLRIDPGSGDLRMIGSPPNADVVLLAISIVLALRGIRIRLSQGEI